MLRSDHDELIRLSFWSKNQKDEPQAVVSHQSAIVLHDLSELLPGEILLTVPPKFRKVPPSGRILHKATLSDRDVEDRAGFRVTNPLHTLFDVAEGDVTEEQLEKAVADALSREPEPLAAAEVGDLNAQLHPDQDDPQLLGRAPLAPPAILAHR